MLQSQLTEVFACKQLSENKKSVGGWINFDKNEVELEPYTEETINFTILTPQDVEVGEHNGCILIQEKKDANASTQSGINLALRTGMRVAVTIPGEIVRKLSITEFYTDILGLAKTTLTMSVKNEGNVSIDSQVRIPLYTLWGKEYQVFEGQFPILRGDTSNFNIDVKKNTWGNILRSQGFVEYDSNTDAQIGVDTQSEKIKLQTSEIYVFMLPEPKGLIIELSILILVFAFLLWLFILTKRKLWIKKSWIDYKVESGDDLKSLSQKFEVNWKLLARANKIKAPYIIAEGEVIKRPPEPKSKKGKKAITSLNDHNNKDDKDSDVKPISSIKSS